MTVIITHAIITYETIIHFAYKFVYCIYISSYYCYFDTLQLNFTISRILVKSYDRDGLKIIIIPMY